MSRNTPPEDIVSINGVAEERLKESFTSPYPVDHNDTQWNALITALANQFEQITIAREEILRSRFIDNATGTQLEKIASIFQLERRTGESDSTLRIRIKAELRAQLTAGTYADIRDTVELLLDSDGSDIDIKEQYDEDPVVVVAIKANRFGIVRVPGDVFGQLLERQSAAGVELNTWIAADEFTVRNPYNSTVSTNLGVVGDFFGFDQFRGGAFAAGSDTDTFDTTAATAFTAGVDASFDVDTKYEGFGDSTFGAGSFDGDPDTTIVFGRTSATPFSVLFNATTDNTFLSEGVGTDVFGGGAFSAGSDTDTRDTTQTMTTIRLTSADSGSATEIEGFSSDLFDGNGAFGAGPDEPVSGTTASATTFTVIGANATSTTIASDDDDLLDGSGTLDGTGTFG